MLGWLVESLRWNDAIDITLLGLIIYWVLIVLRGTRAIQVAVGLAILAGLYLISDRAELLSLHFLLGKLAVYIVLALIILFQQDIRRALARAGGSLFPSARGGTTELGMIEELVRACSTLAARRIGALIALEREGSLDEYADSATALDAQVSSELLLAIFHPTSPLHDGAVVIQKGRLAAAQAFLPLTLSKEVSRFLGTRHRAAIGLTEENDAICLIVSEERGVVSVSERGHITPTVDANDLRQRLQETLSAGRKAGASRAPSGEDSA